VPSTVGALSFSRALALVWHAAPAVFNITHSVRVGDAVLRKGGGVAAALLPCRASQAL
jgi:3-deoxy-D-manno-octulosonic acid (KDO) 8-phosphate synthase